MRFLLLAAVALAAVPALAPDPITAGFIGTAGDSTFVLAETAVRTSTTLEGSMTLFADTGARAGYSAVLLPDARVSSISVWQEPLNGSGPRETFDVTAEETFVGGPGAIPYVNPSIGLLEQVVQRALALRDGGDAATVPLFYIAGEDRHVEATVRFLAADSLHISAPLGGRASTTAVRIDEEGLVLGGRSLDDAFRFERVPYEVAAGRLAAE